VHSSRTLGTHSSTAQVHPRLFTEHFSQLFLSKPNTSLIIGRATALRIEDKCTKGVYVQEGDGGDSREIEADTVVLAAGPWTGRLASDLLGDRVGGRVGIAGHKAHSIVLKTKEQLSAHCLFTSMSMADGSQGEPEVFARPDGTTYMYVIPLFSSSNGIRTKRGHTDEVQMWRKQ
jgi:glycine/D-amino acid oxidase-like deaminating enzyme